MRVNTGEWLEIKHFKNLGANTYTEVPNVFYGRVIGDKEAFQESFISGMITENSTMALYCTNCPYDIKINDRIEVLNQKKLVDSYSLVMSNQKNMLGASRFGKQQVDRLPKIVRLK